MLAKLAFTVTQYGLDGVASGFENPDGSLDANAIAMRAVHLV
jgi:hypothetical protein